MGEWKRGREIRELLQVVSHPAPWFWRSFPTPESCRWQAEGFDVYLFRDDQVIASVGRYVRALLVSSEFLAFWAPEAKQAGLWVRVYRLDGLAPVAKERVRASMVAVGGDVIEEHHFPILPGGMHPGSLSGLWPTDSEVLLIGSSAEGGYVAGQSIYAWRPAEGMVHVLPRYWLVEGPFDLGYQWITGVTRDPSTGRIVGEGIRLSVFELDESGTRLLTSVAL